MTAVPASPISGIFFDWGARPAKSATVYLGNSTDGKIEPEQEIKIVVTEISPNLPYNATLAGSEEGSQVEPVVGNTTTFDVTSGAWSGNYVRLEIEGCFEEDGKGATVGEFVLRSI